MVSRANVHTFVGGTPEQTARKVCEEANEFYAEHIKVAIYANLGDDAGEQTAKMQMMHELGDIITAVANYCSMCNIDLQECVDLAETANILRGRYD